MNDYFENANNAIWTVWGFGGILSTVNEKTFLLIILRFLYATY